MALLFVTVLPLLYVWYLIIQSLHYSALSLDELGTAYTIDGSLAEVVRKAAKNPQQHPFYYIILWFWSASFGSSELVLRIPSLLCFLISGVVLFAIIVRQLQLQTTTACISVFLLWANETCLVTFPTLARPYSVALLTYLVSIYYINSFIRKSKVRDLIFSAVIFSASVWCHYMLIPGLLMHFALMFFSQRTKAAKPFGGFVAIVLILNFGSIAELVKLGGSSSDYRLLDIGLFYGVFTSYFHTSLRFLILAGLLLSQPSTGRARYIERFRSSLIERRYLSLFLSVWAGGVIIYASLSLILDDAGVFTPRYMIWVSVAQVLCYGILVGLFRDSKLYVSVFLSLYAWMASVSISANYAVSLAQGSDWRNIVHSLNNATHASTNHRLYVTAPFVEGRTRNIMENFEDSLLSPFSYYKLKNVSAELLPNWIGSRENREFVLDRLSIALDDYDDVFVVYSYGSVAVRRYVEQILQAEGTVIFKSGETLVVRYGRRSES